MSIGVTSTEKHFSLFSNAVTQINESRWKLLMKGPAGCLLDAKVLSGYFSRTQLSFQNRNGLDAVKLEPFAWPDAGFAEIAIDKSSRPQIAIESNERL